MNTPPPATDPVPPSLPPSSSSESNDKLLVILCHLSLLLGVGFLLPLIVYFVKKQDAPLVAEHAREALNFHISLIIYGFVSFLLCFILIGVPMLIAVIIAGLVCSILAAVKASEGHFYKYPLTLRLIP